MEAERYHEIYGIVSEAMEKPPGERERFIRERCGKDSELCSKVETSLQHLVKAETEAFLEGAPVRISEEPTSDLIDGYEILECIGHGGQGAVYRARSSGALKKLVAIKIIRSDLRTEEILRRFRQELRIYERLGEHPNIARVDGAGRTRDDRPYFIMEYVEGRRIDELCDEQKLPLRDRARLLLAVCEALKHAHGNLVIHRDLKPHNILVTPEGTPSKQGRKGYSVSRPGRCIHP